MSFAQWQPAYAAHNLATFPVEIVGTDKRPLVRNYLRMGRPASDRLAKQFPAADAFGFALGSRSKITVLDCDSDDERVLADAMNRHGKTPFVVRSGSGNFQAWYRHGGERRHIRPDPARPIDVLGGGFVVAPPSRGVKSPYQIISGSLDDLDKLPPLRNFVATSHAEAVAAGRRNNALWEHCMRQARACDDFSAMLDVAETFNAQALEPALGAEEVVKVARSAWSTTERGENRFGQHGVFLSFADTDALVHDPHLLALVAWLKAQNAPSREFLIADGLHKILGWSLPQLRRCRNLLVDQAWVEMVRPPARGCAALYRWSLQTQAGNGLSKSVGHATVGLEGEASGRGEVLFEDSLPKSIGHCQSAPRHTRQANGPAALGEVAA